MNINEWLRHAAAELEASGCPDPAIDARWMAEDVLGMSREAFGEKLGVSGVVVQTMEDGRKAVRDPLLGMMCQIYGLSSEWILYGKGDMYLDDEVSILKTLGIRYGLNDNDVSLICRFIHTDEDGREAIRKMCGMP